MVGEPEFTVKLFLPDGTVTLRHPELTATKAVDEALTYVRREAARRSWVDRIAVFDGLDNIVFEWRRGEGIVLPESITD